MEKPVERCGFPAATEHILSIWSEYDLPAASRARAALQVIFRDRIGSQAPISFVQSTLTMTGSPFEPAFSCSAPGLRYTADPAPENVPLHKRLDYVLRVLAMLKAPGISPLLAGQLRHLQSLGDLRYGAQIGSRHSANEDRYKLYVEIPPQASMAADLWAEERLPGSVLNVPGRNARVTLIGIDLSTMVTEIYYRIENLHPREIQLLMRRGGAAHRAPELLAAVEEWAQWKVRHELPGSIWGFSYALKGGRSAAFSLFTFARTLIGVDRGVRTRLLSLGENRNWDLSVYEQMSRPLADYRGPLCHHGVFGFIVRPDTPVAPWVGLAPPEMRAQ